MCGIKRIACNFNWRKWQFPCCSLCGGAAAYQRVSVLLDATLPIRGVERQQRIQHIRGRLQWRPWTIPIGLYRQLPSTCASDLRRLRGPEY